MWQLFLLNKDPRSTSTAVWLQQSLFLPDFADGIGAEPAIELVVLQASKAASRAVILWCCG